MSNIFQKKKCIFLIYFDTFSQIYQKTSLQARAHAKRRIVYHTSFFTRLFSVENNYSPIRVILFIVSNCFDGVMLPELQNFYAAVI